jgi:hypothetical protein
MASLSITLAAILTLPIAAFAECPAAIDAIATDRPTISNASSVVPYASLQWENGASAVRGSEITTYDLPETRLRLGIAGCTELLVDLPDYTHATGRGGIDGASNIAPAVKHQFQDLPDGLTLSGTVGIFLNSGDKAIAGPGPAPYAQLPWSVDLGGGWSANGMLSETLHPRGPNGNGASQTSLYLDRTIAENYDLFVEYANDYQRHSAALNRVGIGASCRLAPTRQIDFAIGSGLNRASPDLFVTLGYSLRFDRLFGAR